MTKHEMIQPQIIPGFDVLKWKQETQAQILRETEGMTDEEVREYFRRGSEEFREEQRHRRLEREAKSG
jgi:hypothetical protein